MAFGLTFSPEFFTGNNPPEAKPSRKSDQPTSVSEALMCLSQATWNEMADRVFGVDGSQLDLATVLAKVEETNTCLNLDSPVEVLIDPEGEFSVLVYDRENPDHPPRQPR
jgi:hypothetical protein